MSIEMNTYRAAKEAGDHLRAFNALRTMTVSEAFKMAMDTGNYRIEKRKDGTYEARRTGMRIGTPAKTREEAKMLVRADYIASQEP